MWGESTAGDPAASPIHPVVGGAEVLEHGSIVIAAITSCTNTSNPSVMLAAGLLAKRAVERGLNRQPWVKTSLAPGSRVVTAYYERAGLTPYPRSTRLQPSRLRLHHLHREFRAPSGRDIRGDQAQEPRRCGGAVWKPQLRGPHPFGGSCQLSDVTAARRGVRASRTDHNRSRRPSRWGMMGKDAPCSCATSGRAKRRSRRTLREATGSELYRDIYREIFAGDEQWRSLEAPAGNIYHWDETSTYVRSPPLLHGHAPQSSSEVENIRGARALAVFGDSITTDHISPAGTIQVRSPAGQYLVSEAVAPKDFNSYGARRGNHEVMVRGTFANVRIRNRLAPGTEGGYTTYLPGGEVISIYEASQRYLAEVFLFSSWLARTMGRVPAGTGRRRGPISRECERLSPKASSGSIGRTSSAWEYYRSSSWMAPRSLASRLTGREIFDIDGITAGVASGFAQSRRLTVRARREDGSTIEFEVSARIETPQEVLYIRHGGILQYVLRQLLG